jgi:hypothetical protein
MAIIRRELQGRSAVTNLFDGICEAAADLQSDEAGRWVEGSMLYCLDDGKLYVKGSDGTWAEAT